MIRVLVVDDEPALRRAVQRHLESADMQVAVAADGASALAEAASTRPHLVIVDLGLPDVDGIELIRRLGAAGEPAIIVLSGAGSEATKVRALQAGADDYVTKPFGGDELRARVAAVLRRTQPAPEATVKRFGDLTIDLQRGIVELGGDAVHLTRTQFRLLRALVQDAGTLLTHWRLLDEVWGRGVGEEGRQYLRVYVRQLRSKLGDDAREPRFILTETGIGYRWIAQEHR